MSRSVTFDGGRSVENEGEPPGQSLPREDISLGLISTTGTHLDHRHRIARESQFLVQQ
jgi:hypothetical protein